MLHTLLTEKPIILPMEQTHLTWGCFLSQLLHVNAALEYQLTIKLGPCSFLHGYFKCYNVAYNKSYPMRVIFQEHDL